MVFTSEEDIKKEVMELQERIVTLEVKVEELTKRIESLTNYAKELYNYLQKQETNFSDNSPNIAAKLLFKQIQTVLRGPIP